MIKFHIYYHTVYIQYSVWLHLTVSSSHTGHLVSYCRYEAVHPVVVNTGVGVCDGAAVRSDAHTAHPGCQHLQLLGRGTTPSGGCRQEDRGRLPDSMDQLLVPTAARFLSQYTPQRQTNAIQYNSSVINSSFMKLEMFICVHTNFEGRTLWWCCFGLNDQL